MENNIDFQYTINNPDNINCIFKLNASGTVWGNIDGDINNQTDLINLFNTKVDLTDFEELSQTVTNNYNELTGDITNLTTTVTDNYNTLSGQISDLTGVVNDNYTSLDNRLTTAEGSILDLTDTVNNINALIPAQATTSNQLADKDFVNSSIATNTAYFIGTFNSVAELEAYSGTLTNNDYAFVATTDSVGNTLYDRYKYNANTQQWIFEYELNNSSFTAQQWASINSGITIGDVTLIGTALQPNDNISELVNDVEYITSASLSGYATESELTNYQKKLTAGDNIEIIDIEVPSGYTQLEYIESDGTGNRYLNSGIVPNTFDYEITTIAKFNSAPTGTNVYTMWGYKDLMVSNNGYRWDLSVYQQKFNFGVNEENTINAFDTNKHTFISKIYEDNGQYLYSSQIDNIVYIQDATINNPTNITNNTIPIFLFARANEHSSSSNYVDGRIYRHTVKKSGTIIQDLVPAKRNSDNAIGMYDLIADTFLTFTRNPFIAGADAPIINFVNNSDYITSSALSGYQTTSNLVTSVSSSSTDAQYPSAKCVYDIVGNIESILHNINSGGN